MEGTVIGNFRLVRQLGKGGMGEVWEAEQLSIGTKAAIKLLRADVSADAAQVQRFRNEAVAVSKIRHAGIVRIFDVGFLGTQAYLVMEYLDGETLTSRIRRAGRLPLREVCEIGRQIAGVLDATHAAGIIHRDLKPDNVFLVQDAELPSGERAKVLDFGIAKLGSVGITSTSVHSMGTPLYMSPEQWRSVAKVDGRTDAYSLGCVVFEMACGRPPFLADSIGEACAKHLTDPPPSASSIAPQVPPAFDQLVGRLLEKDAAQRPTMKEVMAGLGAIAQGLPAQPRAMTAPYGMRGMAESPPLPSAPVSPAAATVGTASGLPAPAPVAAGTPAPVAVGTQVPAAVGTQVPSAVEATAPAMTPGPAPAMIPSPVPTLIRPLAQVPEAAPVQPPTATTVTTLSGAAGPAPPASTRKRRRIRIFGGLMGVAVGATVAVLVQRPGGDPLVLDLSPPDPSQPPPQQPPQPDLPPPDPPQPESLSTKPQLVTSKAVRKLSGELPKLRTATSAYLCIDATGKVTSVDINIAVDRKLAAELKENIRTWTYAPYQHDGAAIPVCFTEMLKAHEPAHGGKLPGSGSGRPEPEPGPGSGKPEPGSGSGTPGSGSGKPEPGSGTGKPPPPERLGQAEFDATMKQIERMVSGCRKNLSGIRGPVRVRVRVGPGGIGRVSAVLKDPGPGVPGCVRTALRQVQFPVTASGGEYEYEYADVARVRGD